MANRVNELALHLPHPDAVTNAQVVTLLNMIGMLTPMLISPNENIPGKSAPEGCVTDSAAATFINVCNRLDEIIADKKRWDTSFQETCEMRATTIHLQNMEVLKAQQEAAAEVSSPHFRYRPNVSVAPGGWMAYVGHPETPNVILGLGRTPDEAIKNFDLVFKGTVPPYMVAWLMAREQAIEAGQPSPELPKNPNEKTVDKKRNRVAKKTQSRRKTGDGNSGNPS
jgi:hypothetical protein